MVAIRLGSASAPGLASGWTNILTSTTGYSDHGLRIAYRVATADAPGGADAGLWTNADIFFATIYRGADPDDPIGAATANVGTGTTVTHPGLTLEGDSPSMIHVGAMRRNSWTAPSLGTGATNLDQMQITSGSVQSGFRVGRSSNEVTSWTSRTASISPADPWRTFAVEILSGSIDLSTSGSISVDLSTSGAPTKSGTTPGSIGVTLNASGTVDKAEGQPVDGSLSLELTAAGTVVAEETKAADGALPLTLGASGAITSREKSTAASVGLALGLAGSTLEATRDATPPPRNLADLLAGSHRRLARADILTGPAAGQSLPITTGSVTLVHDGPVRLTGSLTVAAVEPWTEQDVDAALDPRAGVEIALAQGVVDDLGVEHWWQVGIVRPSRHSATITADAIEVTVEVADRGAVVAHAGAPESMVIAAGSGILEGVQAALWRVAPWLPVDFPASADWPTQTDILLAERAGDDLWAGCRDAVRSMGRMLTVDETGTVVAPLLTAAQETEPIDVPMTGVSVEVDWEQAVHRVVARWTEAKPEDADSEWQPETGDVTVEDTEAIAALPENVPPTVRAFSGDESILTEEGLARAAAAAELADLQDLIVSGSCSTVPHPDVRPGAVIEVEGRRYRITQVSFDLAGGPMDVSLGNAARTLAVRLAERLGYATGAERDEIVESVEPLMTRPIGGDVPLLVTPTDAVNGVEVGDVVRVVHDGAGRRVATGMIARKSVVQKHSGEVIGQVGGADITVDGNATLRVRAQSTGGTSDYATYSDGDVTVQVPNPDLKVRASTPAGTGPYASFDGSGNATISVPASLPSHRHVAPTFGMNGWSLPAITAAGIDTTVAQTGWDKSLRTAVRDLRQDVINLHSAVETIKANLGSTNYTSFTGD